jgi:FAD:protein FMN transferase
MGARLSKPRVPAPVPHTPLDHLVKSPSTTITTTATASPTTPAMQILAAAGSKIHHAAPAPAPAQNRPDIVAHPDDYDTQSSASLAFQDIVPPFPYHGLVANAQEAPLLTSLSNRNTVARSHVATAVHPGDDSATGMALSAKSSNSPASVPVPVHLPADRHPIAAPQVSLAEGGVAILRGIAMSLPYTVLVPAISAEHKLAALCDQIEAVFDRANRSVNCWNPQSEISVLNAMPACKAVAVAPELVRLLDIVDELFLLSEGRFDPTACILNMALARVLAEHGRPLMPDDVSHLRFAIGWDTKIKRKTPSVVVRRNGNTVVDTDGVAKGYIVDLLFDAVFRVLSAGLGPDSLQPSFYIDWAGDIRALGTHPSGRSWRTAVMKPPSLQHVYKCWTSETLSSCLADAGVTQFVDLDSNGPAGASPGAGPSKPPGASSRLDMGMAIATSGDYYQIKRFGYHHIVNPETMTVMKAGSRTVASVSVMAASCAIADGLATAAMTFETAGEAARFLKRVIAREPKKVFGYCVVGRSTSEDLEILASSFFRAAASIDVCMDSSGSLSQLRRTSTAADEDALRKLHKPLSEADRKAIVRGCVRVTCLLSGVDGIPVGNVDSMTSLSLSIPEPYITFLISEDAVVSLPREGQEFSLTLPTDDFAGIRTSSEPMLRLRVVRTFEVSSAEGLAVLVVAAVFDAIFGCCNTIRLTFNGNHYAQPISTWPLKRSLASMSVLSRAKEVLGRTPTGVFVVTADAADGTKCGLTAGSVASSASAPSIVTFNVLQTSSFYAKFCGVGTVVRAFLLSSTQASLSERYFKTLMVSADDIQNLTDNATLALDVAVEKVHHVADHLLIICRVRQVVSSRPDGDDRQSPLLRVDKRYRKPGHSATVRLW